MFVFGSEINLKLKLRSDSSLNSTGYEGLHGGAGVHSGTARSVSGSYTEISPSYQSGGIIEYIIGF